MINNKKSATALHLTTGALLFLAASCAAAQAPQLESPPSAVPFTHSITLLSGSCPSVQAGDAIAVDWNPGFDPSWAVTGIKNVAMEFVGLTDAGTVNPRSHFSIFRGTEHRFTAIGNGYFHVEVQVPNPTAPGVYLLSMAHANPLTQPDYQGESPHMRVSPANEHLCVTVLPSSRTRPAPAEPQLVTSSPAP